MAAQMKSCRPKTPGGKALKPETLSLSSFLVPVTSQSRLPLSTPTPLIPSYVSLCSSLHNLQCYIKKVSYWFHVVQDHHDGIIEKIIRGKVGCYCNSGHPFFFYKSSIYIFCMQAELNAHMWILQKQLKHGDTLQCDI